jgi:parallel beta helix pectate lyase-like protein
MNRVNLGILLWLVSVAPVAAAQTSAPSIPVSVDCNSGQSLNATLSKLDRKTSYTVSVNGTCTEYVRVIGFENLTLNGLPGATLLQPTTGAGNLFNSLLLIESSRSVTVQGFSIQADTITVPAVGIGHGSTDIRLRYLNVLGGTEGILVFENSQVSIAYVTGQDPAYTPLGIYDSSDVHVERCRFEDSTGALWHVGIDLGSSHLTIYDTTIRNMQVGINASTSSIVDVQTYDTYYPLGGPTDVTIESPAGTNYYGVSVDGGASLNVVGAKLVINKPGQSWGSTTGGVLVSDGSSLNALNGYLAITGSHGQGIMALNNSHATVIGATVTGGTHGGLVAANLSSIDVSAGTTLSSIGGNSVDLFCDSGSIITGSANIAGVPTAQCVNLLATETAVLP